MIWPDDRDPEIVPADVAEQLIQGTTSPPWRFDDGWSISPFNVDQDEIEYEPMAAANASLAQAAPDLAYTVVQQHKRITELEEALKSMEARND